MVFYANLDVMGFKPMVFMDGVEAGFAFPPSADNEDAASVECPPFHRLTGTGI